MGQKNIYPSISTGLHVSSDKWDELIADKNTLLIDTRNRNDGMNHLRDPKPKIRGSVSIDEPHAFLEFVRIIDKIIPTNIVLNIFFLSILFPLNFHQV